MTVTSKKKKILVVSSRLPFVYGGNAVLASTIRDELLQLGYEADTWFTPQNRFGRQAAAYIANRLTDVGFSGTNDSVAGIISLRFPSFAVKHPYHACWLNHCMREYYDLWEYHCSQLPSTFAMLKENIRKFIIHLTDRNLLTRNVTKLFAQSENIASRMVKFFNIECEVLYPPPRSDLCYTSKGAGDYILSISRLNSRKRHDLFIKSFKYLKNTKLKGIIVGEGEEHSHLAQLIETENLSNRVQLYGKVTVDDLNDIYGNALAVFFAPEDEDYGNVTLEAFRFHKPVITASDSGGPLEFVRDGETGFVVSPDPEAAAEKFILLFDNRNMAEDLGKEASDQTAHITWENTLPRLILNPECH